MSQTKHLTLSTTRKSVGGDAEIAISTRTVDRDGDIIEPRGGDFNRYLKNPVVLFGHDSHSLPIGRCTSIKVTDDTIRATFQWLQNDEFADRVKNAWEQNVINAASIGFMPKAWEPIPDSTRHGLRFTEWELLEYSLVPVPANPEAVRTLKSLGLSATHEDVLFLDDEDHIPDHLVRDVIRDEMPRVIRRQIYEQLCAITGRIPDEEER